MGINFLFQNSQFFPSFSPVSFLLAMQVIPFYHCSFTVKLCFRPPVFTSKNWLFAGLSAVFPQVLLQTVIPSWQSPCDLYQFLSSNSGRFLEFLEVLDASELLEFFHFFYASEFLELFGTFEFFDAS